MATEVQRLGDFPITTTGRRRIRRRARKRTLRTWSRDVRETAGGQAEAGNSGQGLLKSRRVVSNPKHDWTTGEVPELIKAPASGQPFSGV